MSDYDDAKAEVERRAQTALDPTISPDELDEILAKHLIATRANSTEYAYGVKIRPATRNGHVYQAIEGGTSGASVPTWPTDEEGTVVDGTVTWMEVEMDRASGYDIHSILFEVLDLKVQKAAAENQQIGDGRGQASSYLYLNLVRERDKYRSIGVA